MTTASARDASSEERDATGASVTGAALSACRNPLVGRSCGGCDRRAVAAASSDRLLLARFGDVIAICSLTINAVLLQEHQARAGPGRFAPTTRVRRDGGRVLPAAG